MVVRISQRLIVIDQLFSKKVEALKEDPDFHRNPMTQLGFNSIGNELRNIFIFIGMPENLQSKQQEAKLNAVLDKLVRRISRLHIIKTREKMYLTN
jgi:hypothetical protein